MQRRTKINLRSYIYQIKKIMVDGRFDESIQHCLHILKVFPKHVEVYQILGQAYIEIQNYPDAAVVFRRVLSIIPDDFIAHVGLSVIAEYQRKLDEAYWHMSQALDIKPAYHVLQNELRRLDRLMGNHSQKGNLLTHAALARLYFQGGLYPQAIAELEIGIPQQPDRVDLRLMLAQVFFASGQLSQSIGPAKYVIQKLPFCLEANRILYFSLQGGEELQLLETCERRLKDLDPYFQFISDGQLTTDMVEENAVLVDWLATYPEPEIHASNNPEDDLSWFFESDINQNSD